ncbi:MAG: hypothetical protein ACE5KS_10780, partial [Woeseiaceae bacterium]
GPKLGVLPAGDVGVDGVPGQAQMGPQPLHALARVVHDGVDVGKIGDYEEALHDYARANNGDLLDKVNASGDYSDAIQGELKGVLDAFSEKGAY